jgi:hypothetical protein
MAAGRVLFTVCAAFICLKGIGRGQSYDLQVVQPPKRPSAYQVNLGISLGRHTHNYEVWHNGKCIVTIPSTYTDNDDFSQKLGCGAEIYWNADDTLVAIDEDVHQFSGEVFIVDFRSAQPKVIKVSCSLVFPLIPGPIHRCRLRVDDGWIDGHTLSLMYGAIYKTQDGKSADADGKVTVGVGHDDSLDLRPR